MSPLLRMVAKAAMFPACQFTNFIARSAGRTAKSWSARPSGPAPSVPIAAPANWRRSFPLLPRRQPPNPQAAIILAEEAAGTAAAAVAVATTERELLGHIFGRQKCGFWMMPNMFPNGSNTVATRIPSPTSCTAERSTAPKETRRSKAACASTTPQ